MDQSKIEALAKELAKDLKTPEDLRAPLKIHFPKGLT